MRVCWRLRKNFFKIKFAAGFMETLTAEFKIDQALRPKLESRWSEAIIEELKLARYGSVRKLKLKYV